jgi:paired amphipathic helix protein Sin3a
MFYDVRLSYRLKAWTTPGVRAFPVVVIVVEASFYIVYSSASQPRVANDLLLHRIDTPGVIERVSMLFHGNPDLIQGFNTFLPPGYRIEMSADPHDPNIITVTTPLGTTTQSTSAFEQISRVTRDPATAKSSLSLPPTAGPAFPFQPMTRSMTPSMAPYQVPHIPQSMDTYSPGLQVPSTTAAASFLGNLSNRNAVENKSSGEFNHAIQYLNKIKAHYSDDPDTYKQFLEILQTYQKEQRQIQDVCVMCVSSDDMY